MVSPWDACCSSIRVYQTRAQFCSWNGLLTHGITCAFAVEHVQGMQSSCRGPTVIQGLLELSVKLVRQQKNTLHESVTAAV